MLQFGLFMVCNISVFMQIVSEGTRFAPYVNGSGTSTLSFMYTVQEGDVSIRLDYISSTAMIFPGGTTLHRVAALGSQVITVIYSIHILLATCNNCSISRVKHITLLYGLMRHCYHQYYLASLC
jgi:hypothetical protein